jgi:predicted ATPase
VCISASMHELVDGRLPIAFRYAGEQSVKNISRPVRAYHVEFGATAQQGDSSARAAEHTEPFDMGRQLPRPLTSFVGREREIAAVTALIGQHRLVTLVGPGGVGKTRLSIEVARALTRRHADPIGFVELAPLSDPRLVAQAIANALDVKEDPARPLVAVLEQAIADRAILLVLDNCEHLVGACADIVARLLAGSAHLRVLASSREPLHITGEVAFPVLPLALPHSSSLSPEELSRFEAVRLFVGRARSRQPAFELNAANAAHVVRICRRLDGIALAIELAAARAHTLSLEQIAARLDDRFTLLVSPDRDALPRQQTLRALIDWSHDLLTHEERVLLRRLSVFAGGCTVETVEDVVSGAGIDRGDVVDGMARLVEKSLVQMDPESGRYRLLETVREYAREHLARSADLESTRRRHLAHFVELAERARPLLLGAEGKAWLERLDAEIDNMQAAHVASIELASAADLGLRLMVALKMYYFNRARLTTLLAGIRASLAKTGAAADPPIACRALHTAGQVAYRMGKFEEAANFLHEALEIARAIGDEGRVAAILQELGMTFIGQGRIEDAKAKLGEALRLAQAQPDRRNLASALNEMAQLHRLCGELDAAEPLYEQALEILRQLGDQESTAALSLNLAMISIGRGQSEQARVLLLQAHDVASALSSRPIGQCALAVASGLAAHLAQWDLVPRLAGAAHSEASQSGFQLEPADRAFLAPLWDRARQTLGAAAYAEAETGGRSAGYDEAIRAAHAWLVALGARQAAAQPVSR